MPSSLRRKSDRFNFGILPPGHALATIDQSFAADTALEKIRAHVASLSHMHKVVNPFLRHFEGVEPMVRTYCDQYRRGEMEKHEIRERIYKLCINPTVSYKIVAYLELEIPDLARNISIATDSPILGPSSRPHHVPWEEVVCAEAPLLHYLAEDQSFSYVVRADELREVQDAVERSSLVVVDVIASNSPFPSE